MRVYQCICVNEPHDSKTTKPLESDDSTVRRALTPTESNRGVSTPPATTFERLDGDRALTAPPRKIDNTLGAGGQTLTPDSNFVGPKSAKAASAKGRRGKKVVDDKPYEGLFKASLILTQGPTFWEITDLRTNVKKGAERIWKELAVCLFCNTIIE